MARDSIRARMRARLLGMGFGTRVTGRQLSEMYVEEGGQEDAKGLGNNSSLFKLQYDLPLQHISGGDRFGLKNVYQISKEAEDRLLEYEEARRRPKEIWANLAASVRK